MAYEKKHVATLDALQQIASKLNDQIKKDETSLEGYLKKSEAQETYATITELNKKADESKLADYLTTADAADQYATKASISAAIKYSGSVDDLAGLAELNVEGNVGNVYNVKAAFDTDETFIEGDGVHYPAGTNVVVASVDGAYKFDVLSGAVDLSAYETAATAAGKYASKDDISDMETKTHATATYATQAAIEDMETKTNAGNTYATKESVKDMLTKTEASGESGYVPKADVATDEEVTDLVNELFPAE